mgnify:CR=1 FL=1|jgi:uncharacterized protein
MGMSDLEDLFGAQKPVIGMIHLAHRCEGDMVGDALKEMQIYEDEGVSGAIVEDYPYFVNGRHCRASPKEICNVMSAINEADFDVVVGVNCLQNPRLSAAVSRSYGGKFVQYDSVQGDGFDLEALGQFVLGGVGFKYQPVSGNSAEYDLAEGMKRCDAVVTTGDGTGIATPMSRLTEYKDILGDFPLIVGAGVNPDNAYIQSKVVDGAIVGSCFKWGGDTRKMVDRGLVRELVGKWREGGYE